MFELQKQDDLRIVKSDYYRIEKVVKAKSEKKAIEYFDDWCEYIQFADKELVADKLEAVVEIQNTL